MQEGESPECRATDVETDENMSKQMKGVHINIVDFVKTLTSTVPEGARPAVHRFPSQRKLREYSKRTHKFFPLEKAKESAVLRALLIQM